MPISATPLVSILIPSFNAGRYLRITLDSIFSQDYRPLEVIVADGGSTDETLEILREYAAHYPDQMHWLSEPDHGPADAVNKTLRLARGEIAAIQSADDYYHPGAIGAVVDLMTRAPECSLVYGDVDNVGDTGCFIGTRRMPDFSWESFFGISCCLPQGSIFFHMGLAREIGGWNLEYYGCDLDYWLRLCFRTQPRHLPLALSAWRRYQGQRTNPKAFRRIWDDYWRMIDTSADIAAAPAHVRRLAKASKHLLVLRCPPSTSRWTIWKHLIIGAWLHPGFWRYNPIGMISRHLPGITPVRWLYRRVRGPNTRGSHPDQPGPLIDGRSMP